MLPRSGVEFSPRPSNANAARPDRYYCSLSTFFWIRSRLKERRSPNRSDHASVTGSQTICCAAAAVVPDEGPRIPGRRYSWLGLIRSRRALPALSPAFVSRTVVPKTTAIDSNRTLTQHFAGGWREGWLLIDGIDGRGSAQKTLESGVVEGYSAAPLLQRSREGLRVSPPLRACPNPASRTPDGAVSSPFTACVLPLLPICWRGHPRSRCCR